MITLDKIKKDYVKNKEDIFETLELHGVCLVKNLVTFAMLDPILLEISIFANIIKRDLREDINLNQRELDGFFAKIITKYPHLQSTIYDRLGQLLSLHAFPGHAKILDFSRQLLKTEKVGMWPRIQLRLDTYNDQENLIGWHHDYLYNKGTERSYTFWIPIVPIDKSMGLLKFIPGSHKKNYCFYQSTQRRHASNLEREPAENELYEISRYEPGDVVIFHSKLVHTGQLNTNPERARMVMLFRMQNLEKLEDLQGAL